MPGAVCFRVTRASAPDVVSVISPLCVDGFSPVSSLMRLGINKLVSFWGQKVEGQRRSMTKCAHFWSIMLRSDVVKC